MPITKVEPEEVLIALTKTFRRLGYDGASVAALARAAGLQKASLYHRFPGGKPQMAEAALAHAERLMEAAVFEPLRSHGSAEQKIHQMCQGLRHFYQDGTTSCLLETLSIGQGSGTFRSHVQATLDRWVMELSRVLILAGFDDDAAEQRAERAVMLIQGGLLLSRATGEPVMFRRCLEGLPDLLLR